MNHKISWLAGSTALLVALVALPAAADDTPAAAATSDPAGSDAAIAAAIQEDTDAAKAILKQSAAFLATQKHFAFTARVSHDTVQANGQKLQFGGTRKVTVRRPDRMRIDAETRRGERRSVYFDGEKISIDLPDDGAYVAVSKPGTLDAAIAYLVDDLETPAPLHEFLTSNFYTGVADRIRSGYEITTETIAERSCHHLAFRTAEVDFQIWVEAGDRPLPCAVVITYKREEASPQFRALFDDWDLSPKASDRVFAYEPPDGAEQLSLQTVTREIHEEVGGE